MAERPKAPSQHDQATEKVKAEGDRENERENERVNERANEREPRSSTSRRDRLDPIELRGVRDETAEKHRRGEDVGASGISNPTLAEEQEAEAVQPPEKTKTRKTGG